MHSTLEKDMQDILDAHSIRIKADTYYDLPRLERIMVLRGGLKASALVDGLIILISIIILNDYGMRADLFTILIAGILGFSSWRFYNYISAIIKLKALYIKA